ncbi:MAG: PDGLE domain-containing protein [Roseiflexaceae bacterium]|nr:PDGLE domain-containing protein [Roseiflexaceae bacterium]
MELVNDLLRGAFPVLALHIPDNFLSLGISLVCWVVMAVFLTLALRNTQQTLGERQVPLMGVMAAFIFAAQMINFPVAGGTSGHLLGGALAAIVLGPWPAMLVMTAVVGVQALLFQDGGLVVMGANILNMGILTALVGYAVYRVFAGRGRVAQLAGAGIGAWLSVMTAALATSLQLWLSGIVSLDVVIPAMLGVHALIGLGEALITVAALGFIQQARPDLLQSGAQRGAGGLVAVGLGIAAIVAILSPLASADPDGLEKVAEQLGFLDRAADAPYQVIPDYTLPFLGETPISTIGAGLVGIMVVAGLSLLIARLLRRSAASRAASDNA